MAKNPSHTIRVLARSKSDGTVDVKSLIHHPMDSGLVKDSSGKLIPAHYITTLSFKHNGKFVFIAEWSRAVSKDPFIGFRFKGGKAGDKLEAHWVDNLGESDSTSASIS
ncbi:MAG: thiosulfate oxidation carrier complex protein SoxZ [Sinobacteraceae bacterium]|nr:thiosulfate oxidation carrier complex protein SoxZ [Nevskiaceae bacterium]